MNKQTQIVNILSMLLLLIMTMTSAIAATVPSANVADRQAEEQDYNEGNTSDDQNPVYFDFVDMKVEIKNVESATQMAVEQWDEFEAVPFTFDAETFKQGYFFVNLDPECYTTLSLLSVIDNKIRRSNALYIPALVDRERSISFEVESDNIDVRGLLYGEIMTCDLYYTISLRPSSTIVAEGSMRYNQNHSVDISRLPSGDYVLAVMMDGKILGRTKFTK